MSYRAVRDIHAFIYFSMLIIYISYLLFYYPLPVYVPNGSVLIFIAGIFGIWFLSLVLHIWFVNRIHHLQAYIQTLENEKQSQKRHQNYSHLMNEDENGFTDEDLYFEKKDLKDMLSPNSFQR